MELKFNNQSPVNHDSTTLRIFGGKDTERHNFPIELICIDHRLSNFGLLFD